MENTIATETAPSPTMMGELAKFPREIRNQIWGDVMCGRGSVDSNTGILAECGICAALRLNRELYDEISAELYENKVLEFTITPDIPERGPSYVEVHDSGTTGRRWTARLSHSYFASCGFSPSSRAVLDHFSITPYHRFKALKISIIAPNPDEPGEVVLLWNHLIWLLNLLLKHQQVTPIYTNFIETADRVWGKDGVLNRSWSQNHEPQTPTLANPPRPRLEVHTDFDLLHIPLIRRKLASKAEHPYPEKKAPKWVDWAEQETEIFQQREANWSVYLDLLLDKMNGVVASKLRLERYATWSDEYFWGLRRLVTGHEALEHPPLATREWQLSENAPRSLAFDHSFVFYEGGRYQGGTGFAANSVPWALRSAALQCLARRTFWIQYWNPLSPAQMLERLRIIHDEQRLAKPVLEQDPTLIPTYKKRWADILRPILPHLRNDEVGWDSQLWLEYPSSQRIHQGFAPMGCVTYPPKQVYLRTVLNLLMDTYIDTT